MRCLNCQTVLMDTDTRCPMCGMATPFGQAAASSLYVKAAIDPNARRKFQLMKWIWAPIMILGGALVAAVGFVMFQETRTSRPAPRELSAADLLKIDSLLPCDMASPAAETDWVSYLPTKTLDTGVKYVKVRSQQETSRYLLLQVQDRWLLAKVAPQFNGVRVEGKLSQLDTVALPKVEAANPHEAKRLLPYQLDGEYDIAATERQKAMMGGAIGVFGVLLFFSGLGYLFKQPPPFVGPQVTLPATGARPMVTTASMPSAAEVLPAQGSGALGCLLATIFSVIWAVIFFVAGALICSKIAARGIDDPEMQQKLREEAGEKFGLWVFFGSIALAILLGALGVLPGTRRRKS